MVPINPEIMIYILLNSNLKLLAAKQPLFKKALIHYTFAFALLIIYDLSSSQKILTCFLAVAPYSYYEMVLINRRYQKQNRIPNPMPVSQE